MQYFPNLLRCENLWDVEE